MNVTDAIVRRLAAALLVLLAAVLPPVATAADDPPGRVGRIAAIDGRAWVFDDAQGDWVEADLNRPLTTGDRLSTDAESRATLRVGSTTLRLGGSTELEVQRLDDRRVTLRLHAGRLALRVRAAEVAAETEIVTAEASLEPRRAGHYRVDRLDDVSTAASWRGELDARTSGLTLTVDTGQRVELWREGATTRYRWLSPLADDFGLWAQREDRDDDERSAAYRHVSPEMTGAEELDRYGRWDRHPEYGAVWVPVQVSREWVPYRHGRWAWIRPWGWTWVDDAPWGFAPFHYGRWLHWGGRWAWYPGAYTPRPVWAPALVGWVGGSNFSVSFGAGGPPIGWVPLAPWEPFVPYYVATPVYYDRINPHRHRHPRPVRGQPVMYGNQGVPNAVTVVPRDALVRRQPVSRAALDVDVVRRPLQRVEPGALPRMPEPPRRPTGRGDDARPGAPSSGRAPVSATPGGVGAFPQRPPALRDDGDGRGRPVVPGRPTGRDRDDGRPPSAGPGVDGTPDRRDADRESERPRNPFSNRGRDDGRPPSAGPGVDGAPDRRDADRESERPRNPFGNRGRDDGRPLPSAGDPAPPPGGGMSGRGRDGVPGGFPNGPNGRDRDAPGGPTSDAPRGSTWTTSPGNPNRPPPPTVERREPDHGVGRPGARDASRLPVEPPAVQREAPPRVVQPAPRPVTPPAAPPAVRPPEAPRGLESPRQEVPPVFRPPPRQESAPPRPAPRQDAPAFRPAPPQRAEPVSPGGDDRRGSFGPRSQER